MPKGNEEEMAVVRIHTTEIRTGTMVGPDLSKHKIGLEDCADPRHTSRSQQQERVGFPLSTVFLSLFTLFSS